MRLLKGSACLAALAAAGCLLFMGQAARAGRTPLDARRTLGDARSYRNLTLFPVYDAGARSATHYLTLDEGLKSKKVRVEEAQGGGEVNQLFISNDTEEPVYIMGGEVVLGGQQDRLLGKDTVIPPHAQKTALTVFCVEHGRWNGQGRFDGTAKMIAGADIRSSALEGAFQGEQAARIAAAAPIANPVGQVPAVQAEPNPVAGRPQQQARQAPARADSVSNAQGRVWDRVAAKNAKFKAAPSTGTYRGVLNLDAGDAGKSVAPYLKALSGSLKSDSHLAGVAVAINGKVVAADLFGDPALFRKLWPKLLRSYAADAAEQAGGTQQEPRRATPSEARAFILAAKDGSKTENRSDVGSTLRLESKETVAYRLLPAAKAAGAAGNFSGGGFGGAGTPVHESVIRK